MTKNKRLGAFVDALTGSEARMREMYRAAFADGGADALIGKTKQNNRYIMLMLALALAAVCALWASEAMSPHDDAIDLSRGEPGERARRVEAQARAEYAGASVSENVTIVVHPREPDADEARALIDALKRRLPGEILGANAQEGAGAVWRDLSLPESDDASGAAIRWRSDDDRVISPDGRVFSVGVGADGRMVTLTAYIRLADLHDTCSVAVRVTEPPAGADVRGALRRKIGDIVSDANRHGAGGEVALPDSAGEGVSIDWAPPARSGHLPEIAVIGAVFAIAYRGRFRAIERKAAGARRQIERDFPDFIGKLSLLLGAGLVITSAIERIVDDYESNRRGAGKRWLYEELLGIRERMQAGNTPLPFEFSEFAHRCGVREVMRFGSVLSDNIDKGSALMEKLEQESVALWDGRKRNAEKAGRLAETKLIFPMVMQVMVVVIVTVAPAAFEMR